MAAWSGFSDEDLRRMKKSPQEDEGRPRGKRVPRQSKAATIQKSKFTRSELAQPSNDESNHVPTEARLAPQVSKENTLNKKENVDQQQDKFQRTDDNPIIENHNENKSEEPSPIIKEVNELDEEQGLNVELENVVKFQQQQKVIEEANKQKKALLSKAIEERRKKAQAESTKLIKIQRELSHLDTILSGDVGVIRDKIEVASLDYVHAQKRYEKAEKEFIAAKMDLFEKSEAKEKLTEHLYTIIHQNEVRKAKKLVELMEQLAMEVSAEEMEMAMAATSSIPPLTNFMPVNTLHQQQTRHESESETTNKGNSEKETEVNSNSAENLPSSHATSKTDPNSPHHVPAPQSDVALSKPESESATSQSQPENESQAAVPTSSDSRTVSHGKEEKTDANKNIVVDSEIVSNPNSLSQSNGEMDKVSNGQALCCPDEESQAPNKLVTESPASSTTTTTTASASTSSSSHPQECPTTEQNGKPNEEKPAKGWSLSFMEKRRRKVSSIKP